MTSTSMATDTFGLNPLGDLTSNISQVASGLGQYIVSPANLFGLAGFPFDVEGVATANLQADITDNYAENNSSLQDHIAIRSKKITLKNYVGELVYYGNGGNSPTAIQQVLQKLTTINSYLPTLSAATQQFQSLSNNQFNLNNIFGQLNTNGVASIYAGIQNLLYENTKQAQAYAFFKALWSSRILCTVQTPFEFMANMAIESVIAIQDEETEYMSSFQVTLKEIRFASTTTAVFNQAAYKSPNASSGVNSSTGNNTLTSAAAGIGNGQAPAAASQDIAGQPPQSNSNVSQIQNPTNQGQVNGQAQGLTNIEIQNMKQSLGGKPWVPSQ